MIKIVLSSSVAVPSDTFRQHSPLVGRLRATSVFGDMVTWNA
jgi:hypothetical protein